MYCAWTVRFLIFVIVQQKKILSLKNKKLLKITNILSLINYLENKKIFNLLESLIVHTKLLFIWLLKKIIICLYTLS